MRLQGTRFLAAALAACAVMAGAAAAQDKYPSKPIKLIVPFAPGGQTDITARVVSNHIAQTVGQPLIIENRGGAGGSLGSELASKAPPDGYTLLLATSSTHSTNPWIYPKLAY
ncbi:MAG: Bug family tripartite tricarboxylate transporter substrate binding protein, partial [Acetobacteraceae bacterium]